MGRLNNRRRGEGWGGDVPRLMREAACDYRMDALLSKECADDVSMRGGVGKGRGGIGRRCVKTDARSCT